MGREKPTKTRIARSTPELAPKLAEWLLAAGVIVEKVVEISGDATEIHWRADDKRRRHTSGNASRTRKPSKGTGAEEDLALTQNARLDW